MPTGKTNATVNTNSAKRNGKSNKGPAPNNRSTPTISQLASDSAKFPIRSGANATVRFVGCKEDFVTKLSKEVTEKMVMEGAEIKLDGLRDPINLATTDATVWLDVIQVQLYKKKKEEELQKMAAQGKQN